MLTCLVKIFEKIVLNRVEQFTETNGLLLKEQFGFRKEHSTVHQVKRITNLIENNKRNRKSTGIVFLDIARAFDTVWHYGLLYKLNKMGFPIYIQQIVQSFLTERTMEVSVNHGKSTTRTICAGLPQGSVLSPILYSLFTSDFKVAKPNNTALYADDTAIITSGKLSNAIIKYMKKSLIHAEKYFSKWKIRLNEDKTQAIIFPFNKSPKRNPTITLSVHGTEIPVQNSVKYLGITLDKKITFKEHIYNICEKAIKCGRSLYPLLHKKSTLNYKNKMLLYKMCIRPILTYGSQVWYSKAANTHKKKLQIIQNKNLKIIFNLPLRYSTYYLHRNFNQETFSALVDRLNRSFEDRNRFSSHELIRNL